MTVAVVGAASRPALAYGTDVHFNLTYVQARLAGIAHRDALWIALADESIDHNRTTSAYNGTIDTFFQFLGVHRFTWSRNGSRWQAYTDTGAPNSVLDGVVSSTHYTDLNKARSALTQRRDQLWRHVETTLSRVESQDRASVIRADIALGTFLHYQQDFYGHRQFGQSLDGQNWVPFGTFRGHSAEGYSPDYVALRPQLAREMFMTSYAYLQQWQERRGAHAPAVSSSMATEIINHMSVAYDSRAMQYPAHRFRPWFPPQRALTHELSSALASDANAREWAYALPNANDLRLQLPYDQPNTPLRDVERRVGEPALDERRLPFSAVLSGDLTQP